MRNQSHQIIIITLKLPEAAQVPCVFSKLKSNWSKFQSEAHIMKAGQNKENRGKECGVGEGTLLLVCCWVWETLS